MTSIAKGGLVWILAVNTVLVGAALAGVAPPSLDWSMPDRYGLDADGDGIIDSMNSPELVHPSSWRVDFDACARGGDFVSFDVAVDGEPVGSFSDCSFSLEFPARGSYSVTVTGVTASGARAEARAEVNVRDWLIVGLGDSYASGEGAPDLPMAADGLERSMAAYEDVLIALQNVENVRRDLDAINTAYEEASAEVDAALAELEAARDNVARKLSALNRARNELTRVRADAQPVKDAAAQWKRDCVDDFGLFRCPAATGVLVSELVAYGISAAEELIVDGYNAIIAAVDAAISAAQNAVSAAETAYNAAVGLRDEAEDAYNAAVNAVENVEASRAAIEESLASVEEAAAEAQTLLDRVTSNVGAVWQDAGCHRSARSGQARAAATLEEVDPKSSVTFVHLACSGATTAGVVDQIRSLRDLVGEREIDAVVMSVGGNDAGFSAIIRALIKHTDISGIDVDVDAVHAVNQLCTVVPGLTDSCEDFESQLPDASAEAILEGGLASIAVGYQAVQDELLSLVDPARVFITEYPNATRDDGGLLCGPFAAPGISAAEWRWMDEFATRQINAAVRDAAATHGWNLVEGVYDLFESHGYCAEGRWMLRFEESVLVQGDYAGAAHPNDAGFAGYAETISAALTSDLYPEGTVSLARFLRGDCNADGELDITDAISALGYQFLGEIDPACIDACDFNDDGVVDVSDPIAALSHQFLGGPAPAAPGKSVCGLDPTVDSLTCESFDVCAVR